MPYYYTLQPYTNSSSRHTCPACGRPKCFTLYVSPDGQPLHPTVGRCDHESSCGYHLTPRQYYRENPEHRRFVIPSKRPSHCHFDQAKRVEKSPHRHGRLDRPSPGIIPPTLIPPPSGDNHLITYLKTLLPSSAIDRIIADYRLASTPDQAIIFLQIDKAGQCRTGKIMQYNPYTGHRIKDPNMPGRINWIHTTLKRKKVLPKDWQLTQCLFGEQLLSSDQDKTVALVESEKTAIISSALMPQYTWLATGGKSGLTAERLASLKGRKIIVFPDVDAFKDWQQKIFTFPHLDIRISRLLEDNATPADRETHIDLADWLIKYLETDHK